MSDSVHPDRLLAYRPVVSPNAKRGPIRINTQGMAPSGRNVGILADLVKMPLDVFCEVYTIQSLVDTRLILSV